MYMYSWSIHRRITVFIIGYADTFGLHALQSTKYDLIPICCIRRTFQSSENLNLW